MGSQRVRHNWVTFTSLSPLIEEVSAGQQQTWMIISLRSSYNHSTFSVLHCKWLTFSYTATDWKVYFLERTKERVLTEEQEAHKKMRTPNTKQVDSVKMNIKMLKTELSRRCSICCLGIQRQIIKRKLFWYVIASDIRPHKGNFKKWMLHKIFFTS